MTLPGTETTTSRAADLPTNGGVDPRVGQIVSGRYRIRELLGEGGMGSVYLAEHTHMRKRVALKLLHAEMSKDEEVLARFRREAEAAAHVDHPNVVSATDFGQTEDGSFFLVLEYVEGKSLRAAIAQGPLGAARTLRICRQIALALERAHDAGIVHRDLKPENVMLVDRAGAEADFVKVLDFGIARLDPIQRGDSAQPLTRMGTILGTPEYMAPEQALGEPVGPASDLYAVGVMMYEMLAGRHPFDTDDRMAVLSMHLVAPVPAFAVRAPSVQVAPELEALVRRLLEKDAKARFAGARQLIEALDMLGGTLGIDVGGPPVSSRNSLVGSPSARVLPAAPSSGTLEASPWSANDALAKTSYGLDKPVTNEPPLAKAVARARSLLDQATVAARQIPRPALIAVATIVPILVLILIVALIARKPPEATGLQAGVGGPPSGDTGEKTKAPAKRASADELRNAAAIGLSGFDTLAKQFPDDPVVARQRALAYFDANRVADALPLVGSLAKLSLDEVNDEVLRDVTTAASKPETAEDAFALLEGPLGARGVDALFDLSSNKTVSAVVRSRATRSLAKPDVRAKASPAAGVLLDLKGATSCTAKHDVLERAKTDGDARILPVLKSLKNSRGCGFMGVRDCWPCLRRDDALEDATQAVEQRSAK